MLKDDEISGNSYTTEFRQYDARLGRWTATDPLSSLASGWTPYRSFFDNPIMYSDPNGLFEKKEDAKDYKKENGIRGRIIYDKKAKEWKIIDKKNFISYSQNTPETIIDQHYGDGVGEAILISSKQDPEANNKDWREKYFGWLLDIQEDGSKWASEQSYKMTVSVRMVDEIMQPIKDEKIALMKELYTIQAEMGGSGFGSGVYVGNMSSKSIGLSPDVAKTFRFGRYTEVTLENPLTLSRYYDNTNAFAKGRFMTNSTSSNRFYDRMGLALKPKWNNMTNVATWEIPANSVIYQGKAAMQFPWIGGKTQFYVPRNVLNESKQLK
jgi:RHS repeat-associated protein